jgi:GxxExxY protein
VNKVATEGTEIARRAEHDPEIVRLCDRVRETSFAIHRFLRHGHLEKIYANALYHRLRQEGITVWQEHPLQVMDVDGTVLGSFFADLVIDGKIIVEIKACDHLVDEHTAQVLGYLRASRIEHAMLINFGAPTIQFKKFILQKT